MYCFHSLESELPKGMHFFGRGLNSSHRTSKCAFHRMGTDINHFHEFGNKKKMQYKVMAERAARDRDPIFKQIPKYQLNSEFKDSS